MVPRIGFDLQSRRLRPSSSKLRAAAGARAPTPAARQPDRRQYWRRSSPQTEPPAVRARLGAAARDLARSRRARLRAARPARRRGQDAELEAPLGRGLQRAPRERLPADLADPLDDGRDRRAARCPPGPRFPGSRPENGTQKGRFPATRGARRPPGTSPQPTGGRSASSAGGRRIRPSRSTASSSPTAASPILFSDLPREGVAFPASLAPGVAQVVTRDGNVSADDLAPYLDVPARRDRGRPRKRRRDGRARSSRSRASSRRRASRSGSRAISTIGSGRTS